MDLGRGAIALSSRHSRPSARARRRIACVDRPTILANHALIGLAELTARYPIPPVEAAELLERWSEEGKVVRVDDPDAPDRRALGRAGKPGRDAPGDRGRAPAREPGGCPRSLRGFPARRQHVHPATVGEGPAFVEVGPGTIAGVRRARRVWENEILPRRVKGYRPAWLDDVLGQGAWLWRAAGTAAGRSSRRVLPPRLRRTARREPGFGRALARRADS